jgi:hypothetical protein
VRVRYAHLRRLTDAGGLYEHAQGCQPRRSGGYCLDDVARALVVVCREQEQAEAVADLRVQYLAFTLAADAGEGAVHNRRSAERRWVDAPSLEDCWGRAVWGLGTAAARAAEPEVRALALAGFERVARRRSPWPRALAFAALGAAEVLTSDPAHAGARALLTAAASGVRASAATPRDVAWPWPEARLAYANAALPEALVAAGHGLGRPELTAEGLDLLDWLLAVQTREGHLSVVPAGGRGRHDPVPGFDQQPIEVAALADACARAHAVTGQPRWLDGLQLCADWFAGANDAGLAVCDPLTGGGYDGLEPAGRNENQGAESTLALLSTMQQAGRLVRSG